MVIGEPYLLQVLVGTAYRAEPAVGCLVGVDKRTTTLSNPCAHVFRAGLAARGNDGEQLGISAMDSVASDSGGK